MNQFKVFETERLLLKPVSEEDADFIFELFNSPKWLEFIGDRKVRNVENARDYIKTKMLPQLKRLGYSNYAVIRKTDNCKIGTCGLYDRDGIEGIELGFAFLPEYEGKGYAYEATSKLKTVAHNTFGLTELKAITDKNNIASQGLLKKLGFKADGTVKLPGEEVEILLFKTTV